MAENPKTEDFFEIVFRLDECEDVNEFLEYVQGKRHDKQEMLTAASQLLAKGRLRSAYILSLLLTKRGQQDLVISISLSLGGILFKAVEEEAKGLKLLSSQLGALSDEQRIETYDTLVAPVLPPVWSRIADEKKQDADDGNILNHDRALRVLQHFEIAVPDQFKWQESTCKLCCSSAPYQFHGAMLGRYRAAYYCCNKCGFLATEEPYWLAEAYANEPITDDADVMERNLKNKAFISMLLWNLFDQKDKFLDYGGGYGMFVRMMRDAGFDYYWQDQYCKNLFAREFVSKEDDKYALVTAFDCFHHLTDPMQTLDWIFDRSESLLFTTRILPNTIPQPHDWDYYAPESGQRVSFYSMESLRKIADSMGLAMLSNGVDTHMFSKKTISGKNISKKVFRGLDGWKP